ncbi:hypothetical protein K488DRAFT_69977 [Vararia minispora EC-137]|uniref:Uncharacterized protein n=1 Tax=Vararia minispora EC-137 TaxID=1314806 RepID=A0ACB8QN47_9AGAM|nr:hypothetical protein K488DRAFT_69977 [Vararia minispora EC-137]
MSSGADTSADVSAEGAIDEVCDSARYIVTSELRTPLPSREGEPAVVAHNPRTEASPDQSTTIDTGAGSTRTAAVSFTGPDSDTDSEGEGQLTREDYKLSSSPPSSDASQAWASGSFQPRVFSPSQGPSGIDREPGSSLLLDAHWLHPRDQPRLASIGYA